MGDINDALNGILKDGSDLVKNQVTGLINDAKDDETAFIQSLGTKLESYIQQLAAGVAGQAGGISKDEFQDLVSGLTDLQAMEAAKLSVEAKVRAEKTITGIENIVLKALFGALKF